VLVVGGRVGGMKGVGVGAALTGRRSSIPITLSGAEIRAVEASDVMSARMTIVSLADRVTRGPRLMIPFTIYGGHLFLLVNCW
jgi:hypothetical protein